MSNESGGRCVNDPLLWEHLIRLSEIVQKLQSEENKTQNITPTKSNELERLKEENKNLIEENNLLRERIKKLEFKSNNNDNNEERILLTQDTILSDIPNDYRDPDLTDVSPVKSDNGDKTQSSEFYNMTNRSSDSQLGTTQRAKSSKRRLIFEEGSLVDDRNRSGSDEKRIKREPTSEDDEDHILDISQVDDSQGSSVLNKVSIFNSVLSSNNTIKDEKINLTHHPILNRPWYPEDFIKNPEYERYVNNDRAKNHKQLPSHISNHFQRQQKHIQSVAMHDFNKLAQGTQKTQDLEINNSFNKENELADCNDSTLVTPVQNCKINYNNPMISPMYKFEITKQNLDKYLKYYPNLLRTSKVRSWEITDDDSIDNKDVCADFLLTQDVKEKNNKAKERAKLKGLRMLFQSCFAVEDGKQLGMYIFRNNVFNKHVKNSEFVIDISIFK